MYLKSALNNGTITFVICHVE